PAKTGRQSLNHIGSSVRLERSDSDLKLYRAADRFHKRNVTKAVSRLGQAPRRLVRMLFSTKEATAMKIKRLGRTGLKVTEVCLGTMTFGHQCDEPTAFAIMDEAAERGVNFIDTADVYPVPVALDSVGRTEEIVGRWLAGKRPDFILA